MKKAWIGAIIGFIVWTVLWLGTDALITFVPSIYPTVNPDGTFNVVPTNYLLIKLVSSVIFSLIAGLIAAYISKESTKSPFILGVMLLIVGLFFQFGAWNLMPVWYHLIFLMLLIPMAILGGKLRKFE